MRSFYACETVFAVPARIVGDDVGLRGLLSVMERPSFAFFTRSPYIGGIVRNYE